MELLFEVVPPLMELVLDMLFNGPWGSGRDLSDEERQKRRARRMKVLHGVLVLVSLVFGVGWGRYVLDTGQAYPPIALWSLLVIGGGAAIMALTYDEDGRAPLDPDVSWLRRHFRFDKARWSRLAWLNLAGALGVALGWWA